jgi:methionine synthase I (cobalamin-dependent)
MFILDRILQKQGFILADGATGTNYFQLGLETGYPPELWSLEKPEHVSGLHKRFIEAGSDVILTNTFGGTSYRLKLHQTEDQVRELNIAAARLARACADHHHEATGKEIAVAGSMGPTGELFYPLGTLTHEDAVAAFTEQAEALAEGGVDMLWIETISSFDEVYAALEAAQKTGLPVAATMTFDTAGKSMMGVDPSDFARQVSEKGVIAVGANCGIGPAELMHSMMAMNPANGVMRIAKGNCGIPEYVDGKIHYHGTPELMAKYAVLARDAGIQIIGGCCGTSPDHIRAMRQALDKEQDSDKAIVDAARLEVELGKPWKNVPDQPSSDASPRRRRRR